LANIERTALETKYATRVSKKARGPQDHVNRTKKKRGRRQMAGGGGGAAWGVCQYLQQNGGQSGRGFLVGKKELGLAPTGKRKSTNGGGKEPRKRWDKGAR